ncbi:MAG: hypothetical protein L0H12_02500, partial [Nitrosospira sp.]|nr:hypothetical protein [Nitrosospira sp.]
LVIFHDLIFTFFGTVERHFKYIGFLYSHIARRVVTFIVTPECGNIDIGDFSRGGVVRYYLKTSASNNRQRRPAAVGSGARQR